MPALRGASLTCLVCESLPLRFMTVVVGTAPFTATAIVPLCWNEKGFDLRLDENIQHRLKALPFLQPSILG